MTNSHLHSPASRGFAAFPAFPVQSKLLSEVAVHQKFESLYRTWDILVGGTKGGNGDEIYRWSELKSLPAVDQWQNT
jgi:hypothetical protein